jgi:outer membrane lipoprotein-sorting protein
MEETPAKGVFFYLTSLRMIYSLIRTGLICLVSTLCACGFCQVRTTFPRIVIPEKSDFCPPTTTETIGSVRTSIQKVVDDIRTLRCDLELSKKPPKKHSRQTKRGPMVLAREQGAHLSLTRKTKTNEYNANYDTIWVYDHKDKEAKYIPTSLPIIRFFVGEALKLNVFLSVDEDTLKLLGSETIAGEPCYVFEGKSPRKLRLVGVPVSDVKVWVSKNDGVPRKITLPHEDDIIIRLNNVIVNKPIKPGQFEWKPPKGVESKNIFGF